MNSAERSRQYEVKEGDPQSVCPRCGIWRVNAGYIESSCGPGFRQPGCFVAPTNPKEPE